MKHIEDSLQRYCVNWFGYQYPQLAMLLHHSPNGGKRNAREAYRFKQMGTRPGFPDLILCIARGEYHGLFVELKTDKGRQSKNQKEFEQLLTAQGYLYKVIRSLPEFVKLVNSYINESQP